MLATEPSGGEGAGRVCQGDAGQPANSAGLAQSIAERAALDKASSHHGNTPSH